MMKLTRGWRSSVSDDSVVATNVGSQSSPLEKDQLECSAAADDEIPTLSTLLKQASVLRRPLPGTNPTTHSKTNEPVEPFLPATTMRKATASLVVDFPECRRKSYAVHDHDTTKEDDLDISDHHSTCVARLDVRDCINDSDSDSSSCSSSDSSAYTTTPQYEATTGALTPHEHGKNKINHNRNDPFAAGFEFARLSRSTSSTTTVPRRRSNPFNSIKFESPKQERCTQLCQRRASMGGISPYTGDGQLAKTFHFPRRHSLPPIFAPLEAEEIGPEDDPVKALMGLKPNSIGMEAHVSAAFERIAQTMARHANQF